MYYFQITINYRILFFSREKIRNEIKNLKREYHKEQKVKTKEIEAKKKKDKKKSEIMEDFEKNLEKYSDLKKKFSTDGTIKQLC